MITWNAEELPRPTQDLDRLESDMDAFGYCLIADALTTEETAALRARITEQAAGERAHGHHRRSQVQDPGMVNQWVHMLLNKGRVFRDLLFYPLMTAVVRHVLGPDYVLSALDAHITRPGNALLPLHIDQWWMPPPSLPGTPGRRAGTMKRTQVFPGPLEVSSTPINPPLVVNAMWMANDFTEENGATRIVPRSHLTGAQPNAVVPHEVPTIAAEGSAGSIVVWEGRTWHAAGANVSQEARHGIVTYFAGPQIRPLQNYTMGLRPEVMAEAGPALLDLLGFKVWQGNGKTGESDAEYALPDDQLIGELRP